MSEEQSSHKEEMLGNLRREHDALAATLGKLTPAQLTSPGVYADGNGEWTVKDILAHITWWEQSVFGWLGLPIVVPRSPLPEGELSDDEANHHIFEGNRNRSLDEVLGSFDKSYQQLVGALTAASEEQINQPRKSDPGGTPIWEIVPGNTYEHYHIHGDSIREWLNKQDAA